jgi:hypothetical protein
VFSLDFSAIPPHLKIASAVGYITVDDDQDPLDPESDFGTDNEFQDWRRILTESGGNLTLSNHGYGPNFQVNGVLGGQNDVLWGPIPEVVTARPSGGNQALYVECRFTVADHAVADA